MDPANAMIVGACIALVLSTRCIYLAVRRRFE